MKESVVKIALVTGISLHLHSKDTKVYLHLLAVKDLLLISEKVFIII
jgi:hypothetical protein